jgi:uracil-DNA glycosylase family 4
MGNYVPGYGNPTATLMVVAEAPGQEEEEQGIPLVGPTGQFTAELMEDAGGNLLETWRTNVFKWRPPDNQIKLAYLTGHTIEEGLPQLWSEIDTIKPNCILALGALALQTLTGKYGIGKWRGSILLAQGRSIKVVPTYHPAALFPKRWDKDSTSVKWQAKHYMIRDFARAIEESKTPHYDIPSRLLTICRDTLTFHRFLEAYDGKELVASDIEVFKSLPTCISFAFTPGHAISVPLVNLVKPHIPNHELAALWRMVDEVLRTRKVIGQNWKFDDDKLKNWGFGPINLYADTMLLAHTLQPEFPQSLEFLTSICTREPYYKDEGKEFNLKKDPVDRLYKYNARDSAVTMEVFRALDPDLDALGLRSFFYDYVMKLHKFYREMENRGFACDERQRLQLWDKYTKWQREEEEIVFKLAGTEFNYRSPSQVSFLLYQQLKCPKRKNTEEKTLVALMANALKNRPKEKRIVEGTLTLRGISKTKSTYISSPADFDGRMRTSFRITGTETGRSSTTIQAPPIRPWKMGFPLHNLTKHGDIGHDIRTILVADPGHVIMNVDLSQAEPRIVALFAKDEFLQNCFKTGRDVHIMTASWFFGVPESSIKKGDPRRFIGKTGRNGGHFDMGKRRLMEEINTRAKKYRIPVFISEWRANEILTIFHDKSPNIRGVYHKEIQDVAGTTRTLINPFGRRRQFFAKDGPELFKEMYSNLPQGTVIDHLRFACLRAEAQKPLAFIGESHDAIVMMVKDDPTEIRETAQLVKKELETPIDFATCTLPRGELIIPAEIEVGYNYCEASEDNPKGLKPYVLD